MRETADRSKQKPTALHWLGSFFLTLGGTLTGVFIARQIKEADLGHTYYEFMSGGLVLALFGIGIMVVARRRSCARRENSAAKTNDTRY